MDNNRINPLRAGVPRHICGAQTHQTPCALALCTAQCVLTSLLRTPLFVVSRSHPRTPLFRVPRSAVNLSSRIGHWLTCTSNGVSPVTQRWRQGGGRRAVGGGWRAEGGGRWAVGGGRWALGGGRRAEGQYGAAGGGRRAEEQYGAAGGRRRAEGQYGAAGGEWWAAGGPGCEESAGLGCVTRWPLWESGLGRLLAPPRDATRRDPASGVGWAPVADRGCHTERRPAGRAVCSQTRRPVPHTGGATLLIPPETKQVNKCG